MVSCPRFERGLKILRLRLILTCAAALAMAGCQSGPGKLDDKHTGNQGAYSAQFQVHSGLLSSLSARAVYSTQKGYGVTVGYLNTGLGWMFIREAWSFGKRLPYTPDAENVVGCGGGCTISETGRIGLTEAEFRQAAVNGFEFKLVGRNGAIVGKLPATAFKQVLSQK